MNTGTKRTYVYISGTIGFLDLKNIDLDAKIVISTVVQKLWSKTSFRIMVANVAHSCMLHIQTAQDIFILLKGPAPSYKSRVQVDICVQLDFVCQYNIQVRITPSGCKPMFTQRPNYHQVSKY